MKTMRWLVGILVLVIVIIGIAMIFLANNMDRLVKQAIEEIGSETLGTAVTIQSVDISLIESKGGIWGLKVANPESFDSRYALQVGSIMLDLDPSTLQDRLITIDEANIGDMQVMAEQKGLRTNLQALLNNVKKTSKTTHTQPTKVNSAWSSVKVRIDRLLLTDTELTLKTEQWGSKTLAINTIALSDIGGQEGVPPEQISSEIMSAILGQINKAVQKELATMAVDMVQDQVQDTVEEGVGDLKEKVSDKIKGLYQ